LFIEMFITALLVFTVFMLAAEKHRATFIAPIGIGLALFVAHLAGARFTGGSYSSSIPRQKVHKFGLHLLMQLFTQPAWTQLAHLVPPSSTATSHATTGFTGLARFSVLSSPSSLTGERPLTLRPQLPSTLDWLYCRIMKALEYETYGAADQDADRIVVADNSASAQMYDTHAYAPAPAGVAQPPMAQTTQTQVVQPQQVQPQQAPTTQQTVVVPKQTV
jgi:hypothetical protein